MLLVIILIILLFISAIIIFGVGGLAYFSAKGIRRLTETMPISSSLSHPVKKSLRESRNYGRLIMRTLQQCPPGPLRDRLALAVRPVDEWLSNLTKLERGLNRSYGQRNLKREMRQVEFEISNIRRQLLTIGQNETTALRELMESKKQHLSVLEELQAFQNRAELKIQKIASDLGATHAEMVLIIARGDFNENRLNRLDENLKEHVSGIRDMLHVMDEMGYSRGAAH